MLTDAMLEARNATGLHEAARDRIFSPVDRARAVFLGMVIVGHRRSVVAGTMFWALPGRSFADGITLGKADPMFQVLNAPSPAYLVDQQSVLRGLTADEQARKLVKAIL